MRNMSFMLTTSQMYAEIKTVTRRLAWNNLKPGDLVIAVEKGMGLKRGEKIKKIYPIVIKNISKEVLWHITLEEVEKEGFPGKTVEWFIDMFCKSHKGCTANTVVNRIEFKKYEPPLIQKLWNKQLEKESTAGSFFYTL
jgi:hypothetical protein